MHRALLAVGLVVLLAIHVVVLHHVSSRVAAPLGGTAAALALIVAKHAGLLTALRNRWRRRS
jgi:hypothetical protein